MTPRSSRCRGALVFRVGPTARLAVARPLASAPRATTTTIAPAPRTRAAPPLTDANGVPARHHAAGHRSRAGAAPRGPRPSATPTWRRAVSRCRTCWALHGFDAAIDDAPRQRLGPPRSASRARLPATSSTQQLAAHPDVDTVVIGLVGACVASAAVPASWPYGSQQFYDAWEAARRDLVAARAVAWSAGRRGRCRHRGAADPPADPPVEDWFSLPMRHQVAVTPRRHARVDTRAQFGIATTDWTQALSDTSGQWQPRPVVRRWRARRCASTTRCTSPKRARAARPRGPWPRWRSSGTGRRRAGPAVTSGVRSRTGSARCSTRSARGARRRSGRTLRACSGDRRRCCGPPGCRPTTSCIAAAVSGVSSSPSQS